MENEKKEEAPSTEKEVQNTENNNNQNIINEKPNENNNNISEQTNQNKINDNQNDVNKEKEKANIITNNNSEKKEQENLKINTDEKKESNKSQQKTQNEDFDSDNSALSDSDISENDIDSVTTRTTKNKNMDLDSFYKQARQYFVMTEGGTPIYSRYGDEIKNCSLSATFSAIVTKFVAFNGGTNNEKESLNYIKNEYSLIVFMKKGKLFFIAVSNKKDSVSFLHRQLELLYHQLLSVLTNDRMKALEEKPATCAKLLLDCNYLFEQMIEYTSHSMIGILQSYQVLPIENRNKLNEICSKYRGSALITCLITTNAKEIIAISKSSVIELTFSDVVLIQSHIMLSGSKKENECWTNLCMPGISADGFLQLYSNFTPPNQYGVLFITEKQEQSSLASFNDLAKNIYEEIKEKGLLPNIEKAIESKNNADFFKEDLQNDTQEINVELLKEFIKKTFSNKYKSNYNKDNKENKDNEVVNTNEILTKSTTLPEAYKLYYSNPIRKVNTTIVNPSRLVSIGKIATKQTTKNDPLLKMYYGTVQHRTNGQFFTINLHSHENLNKEEKYILKTYIKLYDYYLSFSKNLAYPDNFFHIEKDYKFSHGIYVNETYIIFGTFNLFKPNDEISEIFKESAKIIRQYDNNFFVSLKQY